MIFCIDDDHAILSYLSTLLRGEGHEVVEATNGLEALAMLHKFTPDIILCDIEMPGMNGFEFLRAMRGEHHELDDIPFIFMSVNDDYEDMITGLELGADDYLKKPVNNRYLIAKVKAFLRQVSRMHDKKEQEHVKIYKTMAKELSVAEDETLDAYDHLLERLEHEYDERFQLKEMLVELKSKLQAVEHKYVASLKKIYALEIGLTSNLKNLSAIRVQLVNARNSLCERSMSIAEVKDQLDSIAKAAEVDSYPFKYTVGNRGPGDIPALARRCP